MRAIIDIALAVIFSVIVGTGSLKLLNQQVKRKSLIKVQKGLSSLERFTYKMTKPN
jgi:hypothetical protein